MVIVAVFLVHDRSKPKVGCFGTRKEETMTTDNNLDKRNQITGNN